MAAFYQRKHPLVVPCENQTELCVCWKQTCTDKKENNRRERKTLSVWEAMSVKTNHETNHESLPRLKTNENWSKQECTTTVPQSTAHKTMLTGIEKTACQHIIQCYIMYHNTRRAQGNSLLIAFRISFLSL